MEDYARETSRYTFESVVNVLTWPDHMANNLRCGCVECSIGRYNDHTYRDEAYRINDVRVQAQGALMILDGTTLIDKIRHLSILQQKLIVCISVIRKAIVLSHRGTSYLCKQSDVDADMHLIDVLQSLVELVKLTIDNLRHC